MILLKAGNTPGSSNELVKDTLVGSTWSALVYVLTRQQSMSYSGLQESVRSRRSLQPMVISLAKVAPKVGALGDAELTLS
jgi:hypothetical protein